MAGCGGLEEVRGEAGAEFDCDREGVETAVSGARPAPAHTHQARARVGGGGGGGEAGGVQPGGGPGATHPLPGAGRGQHGRLPARCREEAEPAALGRQQVVTQRLHPALQHGVDAPPLVVQHAVHAGAAAVTSGAQLSRQQAEGEGDGEGGGEESQHLSVLTLHYRQSDDRGVLSSAANTQLRERESPGSGTVTPSSFLPG